VRNVNYETSNEPGEPSFLVGVYGGSSELLALVLKIYDLSSRIFESLFKI
jgi:hypothetical protein